MTIKTKFNIGDKVWVEIFSPEGYVAAQGEISVIECLYVRDKNGVVHHHIIYNLEGLDYHCHPRFHENEVFKTKEEAVDSEGSSITYGQK